ncbi:hypothetical protein [Sanguibacter antarcticus]|uniref:Uncharacterized protein n=1 Tax=Sanguibacter antarcticus TaxID=372484 RepID=A0A2A9E9W4_9MICO|nr:hypothetical protein [Sanguibacter antarcticus]PFG35042.1 hypothetical protein ATL42_2975 [Sanguibacter antarcticus]
MTTSVEITRWPVAQSSASSRFLAHDPGNPTSSQAAQYFQSVRSVRPDSGSGAGHDRYAVPAGRVWARFSVQAAVAFGLGVLCTGAVAVAALSA